VRAVQALDLVGQHDARYRESWWEANFEGVALDRAGDRAQQREPNPDVVGGGGKDDGWAPSCLLVPCLWIQADPDDVAAIRSGLPLAYHASFPVRGPVSNSRWRFSSVTPARRV